MRLALAGCIFFYTFAIALVLIGLHAQREIKRESGENPEQSRCCKLFIISIESLPLPLYIRWEGW